MTHTAVYRIRKTVCTIISTHGAYRRCNIKLYPREKHTLGSIFDVERSPSCREKLTSSFNWLITSMTHLTEVYMKCRCVFTIIIALYMLSKYKSYIRGYDRFKISFQHSFIRSMTSEICIPLDYVKTIRKIFYCMNSLHEKKTSISKVITRVIYFSC